MRKLDRSSRAELDLIQIGLDLSRFGAKASDRVLDLSERRCQVLQRFPGGGEACPQFGAQMRWYPAGNYVIFTSSGTTRFTSFGYSMAGAT